MRAFTRSGIGATTSARLCRRHDAIASRMTKSPIEFHDERLRLAIPLGDAVSFAMGWSDLEYH